MYMDFWGNFYALFCHKIQAYRSNPSPTAGGFYCRIDALTRGASDQEHFALPVPVDYKTCFCSAYRTIGVTCTPASTNIQRAVNFMVNSHGNFCFVLTLCI